MKRAPVAASLHETEREVSPTPAWLTQALREGRLAGAVVEDVHMITSWQTAGSVLSRVAVSYAPDVRSKAPPCLFIKRPRVDRPVALTSAMGAREVAFYTQVAPHTPALPSLRCYAAAHDRDSGDWHLVLEDVSATHTQSEWPLLPAEHACEGAMDALAALHAAWWDRPRLQEWDPIPAADERQARIRRTQEEVVAFVDYLGDRLSLARRRTYEDALAMLPRLWRWVTRERARTLVHGDAHLWNVLFPREAGHGPVYLCDWQNWHAGIPAQDPAYQMVLDWDAERRARLEVPLLRRYHNRLLALGIAGYTWEDCWTDYRLAIVNLLFTPAWRWRNGTEARYWWPHLHHALAAFDDLDCADLIRR